MSSDPLTSSPFYNDLTEEQIRKKRLRARRRLIATFCFFVALTGFEIYLLGQKTRISDNITVLLLFNVILILLFLLIVLIIRNLVKLYNERKSRLLGSRFQTRLILTFITLALVPSVLLFFVASKLFSYSVGNWFSVQVEESLQQSMEVAREYYSHVERQSLFYAKRLEHFITRHSLYLQENRASLQRLVQEKVVDYQLGTLVIFDNKGKVVVSRTHPGDSTPYRPADFLDLIGESTGGEGVSEVRHFKGGDYLAVMLPLTQTVNGQTSIWGYILTLSQIPQHTLQKIEKIRGMFEEYKKQSLLKVPVSANYYFTFLLITLLILFSAIWLGFYMARGITVPIRQLAEGTRRVAGGDLNVSIGLETADEIGLLVESFNKMTKDLRENRQRIEQANEDLKFTNIELERRRNYIETVLENIGAGVVSIDKKGRITTFNNGANRILDFPRTDLLGSSYKDALPPAFNDPVRRMIKQMNQAEKGSIQEQVELVVGEINLTLLISLRFMRDPAGRYLGLLIVFEDLTQMIKAQKVAAWQEVAQGIAHEIKNPLTPIQLNTQRLRKKFYEDKGAFALVFDESIDIITQEVEGMKNLLNEFLRFSRMPTPHFKSYSLHKIIEDVIRLYQDNEKNVDIQTRFDPKIQTLNLDPDQIRRVFLNLFDNALDAVDEGGRIEIMTQLNTREGRVKVDFLDNGPGISPQNRDKLFLPHFTTKNRGTGLGLAIVSRIIVDHSGIIRVQDNHPRGTIFIIELPVSSGQTSSRVA